MLEKIRGWKLNRLEKYQQNIFKDSGNYGINTRGIYQVQRTIPIKRINKEKNGSLKITNRLVFGKTY